MSTPVFPRPALSDLITRVIGQIFAALPGTDPQLQAGLVVVLGGVLSRELMNEYAYLDFIATQSFASTAEGIYLDRIGNDVGVFREQPTPSSLTVTLSGVTAGSPSVPAGAVLATSDSSQSFLLSSAATLSAGSATGTIVASAGGSAGNLASGTILTLSVAVAGVNAQVVVGVTLVTGTDLEPDTAFRVRVLARKQLPPQGGAKRDYVTWVSKATPGITRVWVWPLNRGGGTVDYSYVFDGRAPSSILSTGSDSAIVDPFVATQMPADVTGAETQTLTADSINVTLTGFAPATGYTKAVAVANVTASLQNLFASTTPGNATYGSGIPNGSTGGTLALELISDAITQSLGVGVFDLAAPAADVVSSAYHLAQFGTLSVSP